MNIHESIAIKANCAKNPYYSFTLMDLIASLQGRESKANAYRKQAHALAGEMAQLHGLDIDVEPITGETKQFMFASYGDCRPEMDAFTDGHGLRFSGPAEYGSDDHSTFRYLYIID